MIKRVHHEAGISLVELLFVCIIAMGIIYYSVQQYTAYRRDTDMLQVQYNVDVLFQALSRFYQANCSLNNHPDTSELSVEHSGSYSYPVTLETLKTKGYLTENLPPNRLLDETDPTQTYLMQLNQVILDRTIPISPSGTMVIGKILLWHAQVSVLLREPSTAKQYQLLLGADCLSQKTDDLVDVCPGTVPTSQVYAVWSRQPSFGSAGTQSSYWSTLPVVKQFTQMYTTSPLSVIGNQTQYFVCGS